MFRKKKIFDLIDQRRQFCCTFSHLDKVKVFGNCIISNLRPRQETLGICAHSDGSKGSFFMSLMFLKKLGKANYLFF
jgi:hypothetical protein